MKITQRIAILRYIARKYGLDGRDEKQKLRVFVTEQQIDDMRRDLIRFVVRPDYNESTKAEFIKKIPEMLKLWENFMGEKSTLLELT